MSPNLDFAPHQRSHDLLTEQVLGHPAITYDVSDDGVALAIKGEMIVSKAVRNASPQLHQELSRVARLTGTLASPQLATGHQRPAIYGNAITDPEPDGPAADIELWHLHDPQHDSVDHARRLSAVARQDHAALAGTPHPELPARLAEPRVRGRLRLSPLSLRAAVSRPATISAVPDCTRGAEGAGRRRGHRLHPAEPGPRRTGDIGPGRDVERFRHAAAMGARSAGRHRQRRRGRQPAGGRRSWHVHRRPDRARRAGGWDHGRRSARQSGVHRPEWERHRVSAVRI